MYFYRQPIIVFGIIVPILVAIIIVVIGYLVRSNMQASFANKQATFKTYEQGRIASLEIENKVTNQQQHIVRWDEQLSQETSSAVASNLREISSKLPSKEYQQTAFERPTTSSGFGSASAQKSSQLRIAFRGTYRTMQRTFLELETRMPQLQLQDLKIDPLSNQSSLLNFQVTYTAWEN